MISHGWEYDAMATFALMEKTNKEKRPRCSLNHGLLWFCTLLISKGNLFNFTQAQKRARYTISGVGSLSCVSPVVHSIPFDALQNDREWATSGAWSTSSTWQHGVLNSRWLPLVGCWCAGLRLYPRKGWLPPPCELYPRKCGRNEEAYEEWRGLSQIDIFDSVATYNETS